MDGLASLRQAARAVDGEGTGRDRLRRAAPHLGLAVAAAFDWPADLRTRAVTLLGRLGGPSGPAAGNGAMTDAEVAAAAAELSRLVGDLVREAGPCPDRHFY